MDFSRGDASKQTASSNGNGSTGSDSDRAFTIYSSLNNKSLKTQSSISMLRSVSSDDLMMKSSDEDSDDGSDVDIIGDPKGYIT